MLCFSAFTPHSPLLLEQIGKDNLEKLAKTQAALSSLAKDLEASKPDTIIVIATHNFTHEDAFHINLHDHYELDFKEFGDMSTSKTFYPDVALTSLIRKEMREQSVPFTLESNTTLDYGVGVPLLLLTESLPGVRIIPLSYSGADEKAHHNFGRVLKDVIFHTDKRVAVIASGDLSHCLSTDAPMGFKKEGAVYDKAVQRAIKQLSSSTLLGMDKATVTAASECAHRPLLMLFGLLERINARPEILSYEHPFGVGYLVAQFHLPTV